jgi:hypothetical protein
MEQHQKQDPLDDYIDSDPDGETPKDEAEVNKLLQGDDPMDTDPPGRLRIKEECRCWYRYWCKY